MFDPQHDIRVRSAAFEWLRDAVDRYGDVLERTLLLRGFELEGRRVPLVSAAQGIFKPRLMELPLSIMTAPGGPYDDGFESDGLLRYRYRGQDPMHRDNAGLRAVHERALPLAYFHGVVKGRYLATWPVFIVRDDRANRAVLVQVDDADHLGLSLQEESDSMIVSESSAEGRRRYMTSLVRRRLHQRAFRERVLRAYREQCAFCRFRHAELLDAAHITPDADELGEPLVVNGLALCKLHHAAFDRHFLGVRPDHIIEVRPDLLDETDGPTLVHAIQKMHGQRIHVPRNAVYHPDEQRLAIRFARFLEAGRAA